MKLIILIFFLVVNYGCDHKERDHASYDEVATNNHDDHEEKNEHEGHGHESVKSIGEAKSILEVDEHKGFRLSPEAIKTLSIKLKVMNKVIPSSSKVVVKDKIGVYRFRMGFFKLIDPGIEPIKFGDQIVVGGVELLRVSDVYSTDESDYGHSH